MEIGEAFEHLLNTSESIFLDTAEVYGMGNSEIIIGNLLEKFKDHKNIGNVKVASKFMPYPWRVFYPSSLMSALQGSLERLKVRSLDLYQIHNPAHFRSIEVLGNFLILYISFQMFLILITLADSLAEAYKRGLIKAVGVSNYNLEETKRMFLALQKHNIPLASNQVEFSLLRRHPEKSGLLEYCKKNSIVLLAYSTLGMGRLTGKYNVENPPSSLRFMANYPMEKVMPLLEIMNRIAESNDTSISSVAMNYVIFKGLPFILCFYFFSY